jgi:hypothetical protein
MWLGDESAMRLPAAAAGMAASWVWRADVWMCMKDLADGLRLAGLDFGLLGDGDVGELIWIASATFSGLRGVPPTWENIYRGDIAARRGYKAVAAYEAQLSGDCFVLYGGNPWHGLVVSRPVPYAIIDGRDCWVLPSSFEWMLVVSHEDYAGPFFLEAACRGPYDGGPGV